jgi:hypothetical protein
MTPQEKELITTLLDRLRNASGQPKDPEADALIRQALTVQPDMPYYLVQTVLIQDLALHNAQSRIAELERQLADAQQQAARPTSFLGSLFGRQPAAPPPPPPPASVPAAGPWTRGPQAPPPGYAQASPGTGGYGQPAGAAAGMFGGGGGGFLRSAAATAAGVAGGALLFEGIRSLFGHQAMGGILGGQPMAPGLGESVINNYYGSDAGPWGGAGPDPGWGAADQDFSGGQDFSADQGLGGDQDFSAGQDLGGGQDFGADQDFSGGDDGGDFGGDSTC